MKRWLIISFIILAQIALITRIGEAGASFSQDFKLTVFIPPMVGLNITDPSAPKVQAVSGDLVQTSTSEVFSNNETNLVMSDVVRDHQQIILKTLVIK